MQIDVFAPGEIGTVSLVATIIVPVFKHPLTSIPVTIYVVVNNGPANGFGIVALLSPANGVQV